MMSDRERIEYLHCLAIACQLQGAAFPNERDASKYLVDRTFALADEVHKMFLRKADEQ